MYFVDRKTQSIDLKILQKLILVISEKLTRSTVRRKHNETLRRLNNHQLKDIGMSQIDIYLLKNDSHLIDPLSTNLNSHLRR